MKRLSVLALLAAAGPALAQPAQVSLEDMLGIVARSPRLVASQHDADVARAERLSAGALPNPTLSLGRSRPSGGERTLFDANSQQQANLDVPMPIFGQRAARARAADLQIGRAESQVRLTASEVRRQAALEFVRLLTAQEQLEARRAGAAEVERIRGLVSGRLQNGMASRYDLARAEAELALAALAVQRAEADTAEHAALLASLADAPGWRPRASGSLQQLRAGLEEPASSEAAETALERSPAVRLASDESAAAEARIEAAHRERFPVPSLALGRTWTNGPFGAANFIGVTSEIPLFDDRRGVEDKARAEALAAKERERGTRAAVRADQQRLRQQLEVRRAALGRFETNVFARQAEFREMAETAYRLGRGSLFELLDARRTQLEAAAARLELMGAIVEAQIELRFLSGNL